MRTLIGPAICIAIGFAALLLTHFNHIIDTAQNVEWLFADQDLERDRFANSVKRKLDPKFLRLEKLLIERLRKGGSDEAYTHKSGETLLRQFRKAVSELEKAGSDGRAAIQQLLHAGKSEKARAVLTELAETEARVGAEASKRAADYYRQIGALAFLSDTRAAIDAYEQATKLDPSDPNAWSQLGQLQARTGSNVAAENSFLRVYTIGCQHNSLGLQASAINNIGVLYKIWGKFKDAEVMFNYSLNLARQVGHMEGISSAYGNLGMIYMIRGELNLAETMFERELKISKTLGSKEGAASAIGKLGIQYALDGDFDRAEKMLLLALEIEEKIGRQIGIAAKSINLGVIYLFRAENKAAETMLRRALKLSKDLSSKDQEGRATGNLGSIYYRQGRRALACGHWERARDLLLEIGSPEAEKYAEVVRVSGCSRG